MRLQAFWKVHRTFSLFEKFTEKCLLSDSSLYLDDLYQPGFSCDNIFHLQSISDFLTTPQNLSLGRQCNFNAIVVQFFLHFMWELTLTMKKYAGVQSLSLQFFLSIAFKNNFSRQKYIGCPLSKWSPRNRHHRLSFFLLYLTSSSTCIERSADNDMCSRRVFTPRVLQFSSAKL